MVQDGEDDLVHVLSQPEVDLLLLFEGFHELTEAGETVRGQTGQRPSCPGSQCVSAGSQSSGDPVQGSPTANLSTWTPGAHLKPGSAHARGM